MMDPNRFEKVSPKDLKTEEGADELVQSETLRPYVRLAEAMITNQGFKDAVANHQKLPRESRREVLASAKSNITMLCARLKTGLLYVSELRIDRDLFAHRELSHGGHTVVTLPDALPIYLASAIAPGLLEDAASIRRSRPVRATREPLCAQASKELSQSG